MVPKISQPPNSFPTIDLSFIPRFVIPFRLLHAAAVRPRQGPPDERRLGLRRGRPRGRRVGRLFFLFLFVVIVIAAPAEALQHGSLQASSVQPSFLFTVVQI